ncbi:hypothetical protein ACJIZ3_001223 [Penstemon smallii]|uniref:Uncharacterized protein n=1 Tax=Penstemon smallii TaxID=265156 RepID=A0ABD3U5U3_9LAMI
MAVNQKNSLKFLSISSNRDSIDTINGEAGDRDEEFYEEIEAPKFVDFTSPDHFRPDDRYWFCLRVGCNQKHEEEMDSEAIYKNFVLRVMAARSPNVRLKKALDRNASRTPTKCPLSAPPKSSSKPRLSRLAILSSITDKKKRVIRPVLKPESTPVTKTKPVASKYLTTPRNKKCLPNQNSFRSVQNPKPTNIDVPKSRMVAKALVFHSPKKAIKVKTSIELRTPITKLCEGMKKLEISSQRKRALVSSSKSSKNLNTRASSRPEVPLYSQNCTKNEAKCVRFCNSTMRGKLSKHVSKTLLGNDGLYNSKTNGDQDSIQGLVAKNITDESDLQESREKEACSKSSAVPQPMNNLELASPDDSREEGKYLDIKESNNARTQSTTNTEEDNGSDVRNKLITSESCEHSEEQINENNPSEERNVQEFMDDKENATTSHVNRMHDTNQKQNRRKIFGVHDKCGEAKKVAEAVNKHLKEGSISSGPVLKFRKPKPTNPKPFRLRTEERGILKEANLEKRTNSLAQSEPANLSTTTTRGEKLQGKQTNDVQQKGKNMIVKTPKRQERSNVEAASVTPQSRHSLAHQQQQQKPMNSPLKSSSIQRLEKMRKIRSPVQKQSVQPQGLVVSTKEEMISYLVPGKKLDVIHEAAAAAASPEVLEQRQQEDRNQTGYGAAASRSSSSGKRPATVAVEPNFQTTHHVLPRSSCTKKLLK